MNKVFEIIGKVLMFILKLSFTVFKLGIAFLMLVFSVCANAAKQN